MLYKGADTNSVRIYSDNQGLLCLAKNPEFYQRTKYIDVKHHFLREHVNKGNIDLWYVTTKEMGADGLTKPLSAEKYAKFVELLRIRVVEV